MSLLALALIRLYRLTFSVLRLGMPLQTHCAFFPSCSHYAEEAIRHRGFFRGSGLALRRVLRCHFSAGGYDPLPLKDN